MRGGSEPVAFARPEARAAYRYMDAMRFFAALTVVMGHAVGMVWGGPENGKPAELWSGTFTQLAGFGHEAVVVFFVLSGFWISHSAVRQLAGERFWREFLTDRLSRLLIVVVPALALGAVLDVLGASLFHGSVYWGGLGLERLDDGVYSHLKASVLLGNLLFLEGFAVKAFGSNGVLWSVAFEFWYYIWFAALAVSVVRRKPSPALLALGLGAIWPVLLYMFPVWLIGSGVYLADRHWVQRTGMRTDKALAVLVAGVVAMAAALLVVRLGLLKVVFSDLLVGLAFSIALWGLLRGAVAFPRWLAPFARYGAAASFSLYVTHYPLFAFVLSAIGHNARRTPDLASFVLILVLGALAVATAWLFSRMTEAHTSRLRGMIRLRLRPAARG